LRWDIALDIGESGVRMATRDKGIVLNAFSLAAFRGGSVIAIGEEAVEMLGRAPSNVRFSQPMSNGRVVDSQLVRLWVKYALSGFSGKLRRPNVALAITESMPENDLLILSTAVIEADTAQCGFISAGMAAALGASLNILDPAGTLLLYIGAGIISASVISFGRIVVSRVLPYGLSRVDADIIDIARERLALRIGPRTAEDLKIHLGSAIAGLESSQDAAGINMETGFPAVKPVSAQLIRAALLALGRSIAALVLSVVERAPGELAVDIIESGITLTGGGAQLFGMDQLLTDLTGLKCRVAPNPSLCVINGAYKALGMGEHSQLVAEC
jgi:rod shape-determining protein MreB